MPSEKPRYTVILDEELLKQVDDFRFENRYVSRSAATIELIKLGIDVLKVKLEGAESLSNDAKILAASYAKLPSADKSLVRSLLDSLAEKSKKEE
jgi:metal-responsive CopG/Arc/MetJ family transcriptional regulator